MTTNVSKPGEVILHKGSAVGKTESPFYGFEDFTVHDAIEQQEEDVPSFRPPDVIVKMIKQESAVAVKYGPIGSYLVDLYGLLIKMPTDTVHYFGVSKKHHPRWTFDWNTDAPTFKEPCDLSTKKQKFRYWVVKGEIIPQSLKGVRR